MQSLNHRLSGRAFHTIKSYLKHSDLKRIIVRNPSLLIQAFSAIEADVRLVYAGYALIFVHRLPQVKANLYIALHIFSPLCKSGFVTLYRLVCRVRRFAVEQFPFRLGSAIRTIGWHTLCCQPLIHIAFVKGFVYHGFSHSFGPLRESGFEFNQ